MNEVILPLSFHSSLPFVIRATYMILSSILLPSNTSLGIYANVYLLAWSKSLSASYSDSFFLKPPENAF